MLSLMVDAYELERLRHDRVAGVDTDRMLLVAVWATSSVDALVERIASVFKREVTGVIGKDTDGMILADW